MTILISVEILLALPFLIALAYLRVKYTWAGVHWLLSAWLEARGEAILYQRAAFERNREVVVTELRSRGVLPEQPAIAPVRRQIDPLTREYRRIKRTFRKALRPQAQGKVANA